MSEPPVLEVSDAVKEYPVRRRRFGRRPDPVRAVDGVSLHIRRGETLGIVGESGSGKSTLARLIIGLTPMTSGRLAFDGVAVDHGGRPRLHARAQMVFQDPYASLDPRRRVRFSVEEPLRVHTRLRPPERLRVAEELFERVGLPLGLLDAFPHELSGGQRQRVSIARAVIVRPKLLVCDEPVSALDVSVQAQVLNLLNELKRDLDLATLFISHDLGVVRQVSDRVAVMHAGRTVEEGPTAEILTHPQHPYTRTLLSAVPRIRPDARLLAREKVVA